MTTLDPRALRDAFGAFMTGVTVVTTVDGEGRPRGFTANSFTSVSLEPPLLLVCLAKSSASLAAFTTASGFAVNVLAEDQQAVSNTFARPAEDRFAAVAWRPGPVGAPVLAGTAAWFDCRRHEVIDAGDHVILMGRVDAFENTTSNGLGYARGSYFTADLERRASAATDAHTPVIVSAIIEHEGAVLLLPDDGGLSLPSITMTSSAGAATHLARLLTDTGLEAIPGFIYAVYEDAGRQHIVYRCSAAAAGPVAKGGFHDLGALALDRLADPPVRAMLERYAAESLLGSFGVYSGDAQSGEVRHLGREA